eukprot:CFRG4680T1
MYCQKHAMSTLSKHPQCTLTPIKASLSYVKNSTMMTNIKVSRRLTTSLHKLDVQMNHQSLRVSTPRIRALSPNVLLRVSYSSRGQVQTRDPIFMRIKQLRLSNDQGALTETMAILKKAWENKKALTYLTYVEALLCCAAHAHVDNAFKILQQMQANGIKTDSSALNATLLCLYRAEKWHEVTDLFAFARRNHIVPPQSYGLAMMACGRVGDVDLGLSLMRDMVSDVKERRATQMRVRERMDNVKSQDSDSSGNVCDNTITPTSDSVSPSHTVTHSVTNTLKTYPSEAIRESEGVNFDVEGDKIVTTHPDAENEVINTIRGNSVHHGDSMCSHTSLEIIEERVLIKALRSFADNGNPHNFIRFYEGIFSEYADLRQHGIELQKTAMGEAASLGNDPDTVPIFMAHPALSSNVYVTVLGLCASKKGYSDVALNVLRTMQQLVVLGDDLDVNSKYLTGIRYAIVSLLRDGSLDTAQNILERLPEEQKLAVGGATFAKMIHQCDKANRVENAKKIYSRIKDLTGPDAGDPATMMAVMYWRRGEYANAKGVLKEILAKGRPLPRNIQRLFAVTETNGFNAHSLLRFLRDIHNQKLDTAAYNSVIQGMANKRNWRGALDVFMEMSLPNAPVPTLETINIIVGVCERVRHLVEADRILLKYNSTRSIVSDNEERGNVRDGQGNDVHSAANGVVYNKNALQTGLNGSKFDLAAESESKQDIKAENVDVSDDTHSPAQPHAVSTGLLESLVTKEEESKSVRDTDDSAAHVHIVDDSSMMPLDVKMESAGVGDRADLSARSHGTKHTDIADDDEMTLHSADTYIDLDAEYGSGMNVNVDKDIDPWEPQGMTGFVTVSRWQKTAKRDKQVLGDRVRQHPLVEYVPRCSGLDVATERSISRIAEEVVDLFHK